VSSLQIGVDGGASRSRAILVNEREKLLAEAEGAGLNPLAVGWDAFAKNFKKLLAALLLKTPPREVQGLCVGLAGVGDKRIRARARKEIQGLLPDSEIHVITDAEAALWGAFRGGPGLLLIAGTGSICLGMNSQRKTARSGGFGRLLGDEGGGYWIAIEAIKQALRQADRGVQDSAVISALCKEYRIKEIREIVPLIYSPDTTGEKVARSAPRILGLTKSNVAARRIVASAGEHLADLVVNTAWKLRLADPEVALWGGLWNSRGRELQGYLQAGLRRKRFPAELISPKKPPHWGSIHYLNRSPN